MSLGTLTSRIFGLIRDISLAFVFGASRVTDIFFIAYQIPSLFRKLLGEGALSSAVVPVYTDIEENRPEEAQALASAAFTWAFVFSVGVTFLGIVGAELLVSVMALGFVFLPSESFQLTVELTRVMFPFLICMALASVVMGILHAKKRFAPSAFAPVFLNISLIASIWWLTPLLGSTPREKVWALVVGVLVGGFLQFFVQWWFLKDEEMSLSFSLDWNAPGLQRILKMMAPMTFGLAITQMIIVVDRMVATFLFEGSVSYLYYSNRLFQFPFALIGIALGTVVLPESSSDAVRGDHDRIVATTRESLGICSFLMIPSVVGLWMIGYPLIGLLFRSGNFDVVDQRITFAVLFFALVGLLAYGGIRIFVSICYSFEDTMGPVKAAFLALLVNALLDVVLVWYWPLARYRVCGLALAGSAAVWIQVWILRRRLFRHLPRVSLVPVRAAIRHLIGSLGMLAILYPIVINFEPLMTVVVGTLVGVVSYFLLTILMGDPFPSRVLAYAFGKEASKSYHDE